MKWQNNSKQKKKNTKRNTNKIFPGVLLNIRFLNATKIHYVCKSSFSSTVIAFCSRSFFFLFLFEEKQLTRLQSICFTLQQCECVLFSTRSEFFKIANHRHFTTQYNVCASSKKKCWNILFRVFFYIYLHSLIAECQISIFPIDQSLSFNFKEHDIVWTERNDNFFSLSFSFIWNCNQDHKMFSNIFGRC